MRIAHIDLNRQSIAFEEMDSTTIRTWGGGSGLASCRLYREVGPKTDPFAAGNEVWIIGGPLTGTIAPCSGRIEVVTKSALTGLLGLSNTGGLFGARLKNAGVDGLVLRGTSQEPVYVRVRPQRIEFRNASHLWGKDTWETSERIGEELNDPGLKRIQVMAIGPAGENRVRFACLINERYHAAARGGAGAVLGAKKVKAIAVEANGPPAPPSPAFREAARRAAKRFRTIPPARTTAVGVHCPSPIPGRRWVAWPAETFRREPYPAGGKPGERGRSNLLSPLPKGPVTAAPCPVSTGWKFRRESTRGSRSPAVLSSKL